MIDEKIIMGVRNKNADAKKELISLTQRSFNSNNL